MSFTKGDIATILALLVLIVALVFFAIDSRDLHSTWPESAEFSQLMTGQERFSEHETNVAGLTVIVDHETGAQYLCDGDGMTALLSADGTPMLVAEVGE